MVICHNNRKVTKTSFLLSASKSTLRRCRRDPMICRILESRVESQVTQDSLGPYVVILTCMLSNMLVTTRQKQSSSFPLTQRLRVSADTMENVPQRLPCFPVIHPPVVSTDASVSENYCHVSTGHWSDVMCLPRPQALIFNSSTHSLTLFEVGAMLLR